MNEENIRYMKLDHSCFNSNALNNFIRHQEIFESWRKIDGEWKLILNHYVEDWSPIKRHAIASDIVKHLNIDQSGFGAFVGNQLVGFSVVSHRLFGAKANYAQWVYLHVSEDYRYQGIGRKLFDLTVNEAKDLGAQKLYISAHSSKETQAAYRALGCVHAAEVNQELTEKEPFDLPLEYDLRPMKVEINSLTVQQFLELYTSVGWAAPGIDQIVLAINHSVVTFAVYEDKKAVGMARLLGDRGMSFYLKDFVVMPAYQSKGVGTLLIESVERYIRDTILAGWAVSLELISTKEAVAFYKKRGFEERPCEWDGPGMFKMIR